MRDREIDEVLQRAAQTTHAVDPALLEGIAKSLGSSMQPVRPLPPTWLLAGGLVLICAGMALAGAARAGFYGIEKLDVGERALIFTTLGILIWAASSGFVSEMIPGSSRRVAAGTLLGLGSVTLLTVFALLFRDYRTDHLVSAGVVCLMTGLLHAIPTGLIAEWLLRRGFAVHSIAAGLAAGTLAGLTGVTMLELHCANFQALHVLLWHTAVVPVSGAVGMLAAWALGLRSSSSANNERFASK